MEAKVDTWIKAGYKLLGSEGMDGIKVERLAHALDLNKSGFYHYFGDMKGYVKGLLEHHVHLAKQIAKDIRKCEVIDPDLLQLIVRHKQFFLVESQLLVKGRPIQTQEDVELASKIIKEEFLPLWKKVIQLSEDSTVAQPYLDILRHFFYARITPDNINYQFLRQLVSETRDVFQKVAQEKHVSQNMKRS